MDKFLDYALWLTAREFGPHSAGIPERQARFRRQFSMRDFDRVEKALSQVYLIHRLALLPARYRVLFASDLLPLRRVSL